VTEPYARESGDEDERRQQRRAERAVEKYRAKRSVGSKVMSDDYRQTRHRQYGCQRFCESDGASPQRGTVQSMNFQVSAPSKWRT